MVSALLPNEGWRYQIESKNEAKMQWVMGGRNAAVTLVFVSSLSFTFVKAFLCPFSVLLWFVFLFYSCFLS